jgi:hypothetical protein
MALILPPGYCDTPADVHYRGVRKGGRLVQFESRTDDDGEPPMSA